MDQIAQAGATDLFGAETFAESQVGEFVQGLVQRLLADPNLIKQSKVNSKKNS